jgi:hypothetical protein
MGMSAIIVNELDDPERHVTQDQLQPVARMYTAPDIVFTKLQDYHN